ncbi:MAG TPA: ABC transporter substrate-binding protein [Geminicoccus sp.]|jgi:peptide/nickel transport system substrate-binding protein|uniref:ABC transporter substrate-binding protein n=1 Tax=Geminicoccus sp. TaxID=2024832 RepID=UPI002E361AE5|nr:ABC transporter substrate-binding protein [Geminicoccus sp.]HEX2529024.1 ABC transporter substrate-binding protein [Geminicoccus sp.]
MTSSSIVAGSRRSFLKTSAAGAAALTLPAPFIKRAYGQAKKTMVFASGEPVTGNWDPTSHTVLAQINLEGFVFGQLFRTPMRSDNPTEIVWELATGQKILDLYTIEYALRPDVTFHDGKKFGAEDVKATFEYASQPTRPAAWYPGPCEVEVVDDLTVRVHTKKGNYPAAAFYFLSGFLPIMSAKDIADPATLQARPNGTGPFKFDAQRGNTTVLKAFDGYMHGKPLLEEVQFAYIGDATTRVLALMSGEIDVTERLEPEQFESLESESKVKLSRTIATENKYLHFRCDKTPFDNPVLRQAASHAIDREQVLAVMGAAGHASNNYISPVKFGYVDLPNYPTYDPAKCQELLSQAGFPNGQGLPEMEYTTSTGFYPKTKEYGEVIAAMLQEQGFPIKFTVMETAAWGARLYQQAGQPSNADMTDCGWSTGSPEPDLVLRSMFYGKAGPKGGLINGIQDPDIDAALNAEQAEPDPAKRSELIAKATGVIADKTPSLSLFTSVLLHGYRNGLEGLYFFPNGPIDATKAEFKA